MSEQAVTSTAARGCPGDGDPARRCVSADSPLGSALLGARPGAAVEVAAPGGSWSVVVLAVE
jgi:transcription elongation GreA/GreB family factor